MWVSVAAGVTSEPMATRTALTAEQYLALPASEEWTELIDGEVVVNAPTLRHQAIVGALYGALSAWTKAKSDRGRVWVGPVDVVIGEHDVFAPDVVWITQDRLPDPDAARITAPPDLVVEVRSRSTWHFDLGAKQRACERIGVRELWLVDSVAATVVVRERSAREAPEFDASRELAAPASLTSALLPGFAVPVAGLFD